MDEAHSDYMDLIKGKDLKNLTATGLQWILKGSEQRVEWFKRQIQEAYMTGYNDGHGKPDDLDWAQCWPDSETKKRLDKWVKM